MDSQDRAINEAAKILKNSKNVVAFTGAGISVESGIPDFRSVGGLWDRFNPDLYADYFTFLDEPHYYWKLERELAQMGGKVKPNPAQLALVDLEKMGKLKAIITQNIDSFTKLRKAQYLYMNYTDLVLSMLKCRNDINMKKY